MFMIWYFAKVILKTEIPTYIVRGGDIPDFKWPGVAHDQGWHEAAWITLLALGRWVSVFFFSESEHL